MFNNKNYKFLAILVIILCTNTSMAKDKNIESPTHQMINWFDPIEVMDKQLDYFDNYWSRFYNRYHKGYYSINNKFIVQDKQYLMILEVPGFDREQIKIKLSGNRLVISGNLKKETITDNQYLEQNNFNFSFVLNEDVNKEKITSNLKNGVLTIILPRVEVKNAEAKEITIN